MPQRKEHIFSELISSSFTPYLHQRERYPKQVLMYDLKVAQSGELAAQMDEEGSKEEETHLCWDLKGEEILSLEKRAENMETCGLKNGTTYSSIWEGN